MANTFITSAATYHQTGKANIKTDAHWKEVDLPRFWPLTQQKNSPWGLDRISDYETLRDCNFDDKRFRYLYEDWVPVDIYVVDSGVRISHKEFEKNRARWGYVADGEKAEDLTGQGTAVASVAAGVHCGVAKHANIVACKIGTLNLENILSCLKTITTTFEDEMRRLKSEDEVVRVNTTRSSVVVISSMVPMRDISPEDGKRLDIAVGQLIEAGVHCVIAAGDDNVSGYTLEMFQSNLIVPRHGIEMETHYFDRNIVKDCIVVGGCTIADERSPKSNFGPLDIFAPGQDVYCASNASDTDFRYLTGTSVASAHVAGLVAYFISLLGPTTPKKMKHFIKEVAIIDALVGDIKSPNLLANNCYRYTHPINKSKKDDSKK